MSWIRNIFRKKPLPEVDLKIAIEVRSRQVSDEEAARMKADAKAQRDAWNGKPAAEQNAIRAEKFRALSAAQRERRMRAGIKKFTWLYSGGAYPCPTCKAQDGKVFSYTKRPRFGYPGDTTCCPTGVCGCADIAIIKGFD